jgi:HEAT repeat protein
MVRALVVIAIVLLAVEVVLLLALAVRRVQLAARERRHAEAEQRVRPLAIALVEGEELERPVLSEDDQTVLAEVLSRYSRMLSGDATDRIAEYFRSSGGLETAVAGLRSRRAWKRARAAYALGDMQCAEATPDLLTALDDRSGEVRAAAARSLGRLKASDLTLPLIEAFLARRVPRGIAGVALVELGPAAVPELLRIADHPEPQVRATAVRLLGLVGDSGDSAVAVRALRDPSAEVRASAAEALGRIGTSASETDLRAALGDRAHFVRALAAGSLGAIDAPAALPKLLEIARTDDFRPARAAAQAVARIDPRALREAAAQPGAGPHLHEAADLEAI